MSDSYRSCEISLVQKLAADRFVASLVRYRVHLSSLLFTTLLLLDVASRELPQNGWYFAPTIQGYFGLAFVIAGLAIRSWAAGVLVKNAVMATTGPYSICRHPLYLGSFFMMIGFCALIGHYDNAVATLGIVTVVYSLAICAEERKLLVVFGRRWADYAIAVPLVPTGRSKYLRGAWTIRRWKTSREHRAALGGLGGLVAVELWRLLG